MRGVALKTLRTRVRRACDIESATARFPDAELNDYINESNAELYDLIRSNFGPDYYRKTYSFQTFGNAASYPLPSDFLDLISVDVPLGGNLVLTARPYMENERNLFKFFPFGAWTLNQPIFYRLTGAVDATGNTPQTISFIPTPTGAYNIIVNYVSVPPILVNDTDTFDGIAGWEQYTVADAAIKCALKDEAFDLIAALTQVKGAVGARIEKMASEHDAGQADRVQDVTKVNDSWDW
jgi:hypothetical protein